MTIDSKIDFIDTIFTQKVDDEIVLFDNKTELYYGLNNIGSIIWKAIKNSNELSLVHQELTEKFDVDSKTLEKDLLIFVEKLIDNNLLKEKY